jgi:hypothetical protein
MVVQQCEHGDLVADGGARGHRYHGEIVQSPLRTHRVEHEVNVQGHDIAMLGRLVLAVIFDVVGGEIVGEFGRFAVVI